MTVEVATARTGDLAGIRGLAGLSPASRRLLHNDITAADRCCLVALDDGEVVGYAAAVSVLDEATILDLAVARDRRRQGIARRLLGELAGRLAARGVVATTLEVRRDNDAAVALYRQLGFAIEGVRPRYYPDGEDALLLWRRN
jgi:[ribosomal protein S18]-alanine N-acetyltransferase